MGNCENLAIRLGEEARTKLMDFVLDRNGKDGASLHYIVLEGDCVLVTIERVILIGDDDVDCPIFTLCFEIKEYRAYENCEMKISRVLTLSSHVLQSFEKHVSLDGAFVIEDTTRTALDVFMSVFNDMTISCLT